MPQHIVSQSSVFVMEIRSKDLSNVAIANLLALTLYDFSKSIHGNREVQKAVEQLRPQDSSLDSLLVELVVSHLKDSDVTNTAELFQTSSSKKGT